MAREHNPLTPQGAVLNMVNDYQGGRDAIAHLLGVDSTHLKNQVYQQKGMSVPTERALLIQEFTGRTDFAEAVAHQSGGVFIKLPAAHNDLVDADINEQLMQATKNLGLFINEFLLSTEDEVLDPIEERRMQVIFNRLGGDLAAAWQTIREVYKERISQSGENHG